jgi:hypothetical protein|tara:strand:- start:78 stop:311 length:234 start_codon:yes stop_codon:yes gene_type:complete
MRTGQPILVTENEDVKQNVTMHNSKLTHIIALIDEVECLKGEIRTSGTGHIYTTISTLENRIQRLRKELEKENEDYN